MGYIQTILNNLGNQLVQIVGGLLGFLGGPFF
jgi:hypothetical protein